MTTQCYGVDGTPDKQGRYIPCNITAVEEGSHSGCCAPGDNCLTNGLCQGQSDEKRKANLYWRNGCTDPTWEDAACARHCIGMGAPDTHAVFYCLTGDSWCCPTGTMDLSMTINTTCCNDTNLVFEATDPTVYTIAEEDFANTADPTYASTASAASQSTTTTATGSTTTSAAASQASAVVSASPSSAAASTTGIYAGAPMGVVFGAIAIGLMVMWPVRARKSTRR